MALLETKFYARSIDLSVGMNIILPEHSEAWKEPPAVLYLLHGLSGDHTSWCRNSNIERYAREYNLAVIMPDAYKSFYSDMKHGSNYSAFFTEELPMLIQRWLNVSTDPAKTFIAGSSMGGYGAVKLALAHPGRYSACAALAGALDLASHISDEWDESRQRTFEAVFGDIRSVPSSDFDLIEKIRSLEQIPETEFYAACGTEDYLYQDSVTFREAAAEAGLYLTYEECAAEHNWDFWDKYIQRVLEWLPIEKLQKPTVN